MPYNGSALGMLYLRDGSGNAAIVGHPGGNGMILDPTPHVASANSWNDDTNFFLLEGGASLGNPNPTARFQIADNADVSLTNEDIPFLIGWQNSTNLAFDRNEIQARNNNAASVLYLQSLGGNLNAGSGKFFMNGTTGDVGIGNTSPNAKLHVSGNIIAATPTANNHVATKAYVDTKVSAACTLQTTTVTRC